MSEAPNTPAPTSNVVEFEFAQFADGTKHSFDLSTVPAAVRFDFLTQAVRTYCANRLNSANTRHEKDEAVIAWNAYDEAVKADALQSAVPMPTVERAAAPDFADVLKRAFEDLAAGNVRKQGTGEKKARATKDPLVVLVTEAVAREVWNTKKVEDPKYSYLKAKAEVGADGVAYLNKLIDAKVEAGANRADLEKMLAARYINPAKLMLNQSNSKAMSDLPSIL